jgi:hypothetical protein
MQEEPLSSPQAILPGNSDRQLTLPADLIHRGLELAQRLQSPQVIHQSLPRTPREFLVRCRQIKLKVVEERADGHNRADLLLGDTIDLMVSVRPDGMTFSKIALDQRLDFVPIWNDGVYAWLKSLGTGEPPCIRNSDYELFYYYYEEQGKSTLELVPSEKLTYSGPIVKGDPRHMKAISIFLIREELPVILQISAMDRRCAVDLEALQALLESIRQIKN